MARRRYLSTNISTDPRIRDVAAKSEFAALFYTWTIPHADDDGVLPSDPDTLLMTVLPGFRWRGSEDVAAAVQLLLEHELYEIREDGRLGFPGQAFYRYQTYISNGRRVRPPEPPPEEPKAPAQLHERRNGAHHRKTPQNAAMRRNAADSAQNTTSVSLSVSVNSDSGTDCERRLDALSTQKSELRSRASARDGSDFLDERSESTSFDTQERDEIAYRLGPISEELHDDNPPSSVTRVQDLMHQLDLESYDMDNALKEALRSTKSRRDDTGQRPLVRAMAYFLDVVTDKATARAAMRLASA